MGDLVACLLCDETFARFANIVDGDSTNGRKECPECGDRDTEKTGKYAYRCGFCGHEWRDSAERRADLEGSGLSW